jgi:serine/threonine-protein kinase
MWDLEWELDDGSPVKGGQGSVSKVRRRIDGTLGALKLLHPEHLRKTERRYRMQQEANALIALAGQGVPHLLASNVDKWTETGVPLFIIMEWIEGKTLANVCSQGPIALDQALVIMDKVLNTIALCHQIEIHHRDLKPDNVILQDGAYNAPVLVDFGMTWTQPDDSRDIRFETLPGQELGNRFLRLPEYAPGQNLHDARSDISMAVGLLFFMLTARAPRQLNDSAGRMPHEISEAHFREAVRDDVRWPRLRRVFNIGFQLSLDLRFQTIQALKERLANLTPPHRSDARQELQEELAKITDIFGSVEARLAESYRTKITEALNRFLAALNAAISGSQFILGGSGPNVLRAGAAGDLRFFMVQSGTSQPQVSFYLLITIQGGDFKASVQIEDKATTVFYSGPVADPDSLYEAVESQALAVARLILQAMGEKLREQLRPSE